MTDLKQHSPYSLVETATQIPGVDFVTRSPNGPFVDLGIVVHRFNPGAGASHERMYLSVDTVRELAVQAGLIPDPSAEPVEETPADPDYPPATADYARGYLDALKERLDNDLNSALDTLGFLVDRLRELDRVRSVPRTRAPRRDAGALAPVGAGASGDDAVLPESAEAAGGILAGLDFEADEPADVDGEGV